MPEWLIVGGDLRTVILHNPNNIAQKYHTIPMQYDLELGATVRNFLIVGSYGFYGEEKKEESRRHYLKYKVGDWGSIRAGKFLYAYGLNHPDHRSSNRGALLLGQGAETYNAELQLKSEFGELFVTSILGGDDLKFWTNDEGLKVYSQSQQGLALRASIFPFDRYQVGFSYRHLHSRDKEHSYTSGIFVLMGMTKWLYCMSDLNLLERYDQENVLQNYSKIGVELYRGIHLFYEYDVIIKATQKNSVGFIWYPRPHFEFLAKAEVQNKVRSYLLLTHYYF